MADHNHTKTAIAGGDNIRRCRVVYLSDDFTVLEMSATATSFAPFGITQAHSRKAPGTPFDTSLIAANNGDELLVNVEGAIALAECGGTVTAGVPVIADATARIVNTPFTPVGGASLGVSWGWEVGVPLEDGAAGDVVRLQVKFQRASRNS